MAKLNYMDAQKIEMMFKRAMKAAPFYATTLTFSDSSAVNSVVQACLDSDDMQGLRERVGDARRVISVSVFGKGESLDFNREQREKLMQLFDSFLRELFDFMTKIFAKEKESGREPQAETGRPKVVSILDRLRTRK